MSAQFDAGSIEGTLDLDTSPFERGLRVARQEAKNFEDKQIDPTLGLDMRRFMMQRADVLSQLGQLDRQEANPSVDLDTGAALAKIAALRAAMSTVGKGINVGLDAGGLGKALTGPLLAAGKLAALPALLMGVAAAAAPATAAIVAFGGAAAAAFAGAAIGVGLFGVAVGSAMKQIIEANEAGVELTGWAGKAQDAFKGMGDAWADLMKEVQPEVFKVLHDVFEGLSNIIPKLAPTIVTVAKGFREVVAGVGTLGPQFDTFLKSLNGFLGGFMSGLAKVLPDLLSGMMNLFRAMLPLTSALGGAIIRGSEAFRKWGEDAANGGLTDFIDYATTYVPMFTDMIGDLFEAIFNLGKGLQALTGPAIGFFSTLFETLADIDIAPLAAGFGEVFKALTPVIPVLGSLIQGLIDLAGPLIGEIGKVFQPLLDNLDTMAPAFTRLKDAVAPLLPKFAEFVGTIANFLNDTGIKIINTLLDELARVIEALGPIVLDLAIWLEGLIDRGLEAMLPALEAVLDVVADLAEAFADVLGPAIQNVTEWMDKNPEVVSAFALTLGGLALAIGAVTLATAAFSAVLNTTGIPAVIIAIAALVAGIVYAYKHFEGFRNVVNAVGSAIKDFAVWLKDEAWPAIKVVAEELAKALWPILVEVAKVFRDVGSYIVGTVIPAVVELARKVGNNLKPIWEQLSKTFKEDVLPGLRVLARVFVEDVLPAVRKAINYFRENMLPVLMKWWNFIGRVIAACVDLWTTILGKVIPPIIRWVGFVLKNVIPAIALWISHVAKIISWLIDFGRGVGNAAQKVMDFARDVGSAVGDVFNWFKELPGKIWDLGGDMLAAGKHMMEQVIQGIKNGVSAASGLVSDITSSLAYALKDSINNVLGLPINTPKLSFGKLGSFGPYEVIPRLAAGGVTMGRMFAEIGDNPGGKEAVVPLDKYDLPRKGDIAAIAARSRANEARIVALLERIADKAFDPETLAELLGSMLGDSNKATIRAMVQAARSA